MLFLVNISLTKNFKTILDKKLFTHPKMPEDRSKEELCCKVYVGNLGTTPPAKEDVEDIFGYYGKLANVWIARSPPGFAYRDDHHWKKM